MRIILLRCFVSWWFIPLVWLIIWPISWLVVGRREATDIALELTHDFWRGVNNADD